MSERVVVIGAGVIGVGSALAIQQALPEVKVTIMAAELTPNTTGDGAAGLWGPHLVTGDPDKIAAWGQKTHDLFHHLWLEGDCPGIGLLSGHDAPDTAPHNVVPFFHDDAQTSPQPHPYPLPQPQPRPSPQPHLQTSPQLQSSALQATSDVKRLSQQVTFYAEPAKLLPFLLSRFRARGGTTVTSFVTSLDQLASYDVIVNCSGLGARQLVPDPGVRPVRGQVVRVRAPFVKNFLAANKSYVIPNGDVTVLGGTAQVDDWRRVPDAADTARIVDGCCRLVPALRNAAVVNVWAGLRPVRQAGVRLETELRVLGGRERPVVHNYGHGGAGVTLFWGCALDVAALVRQQVQALRANSKL